MENDKKIPKRLYKYRDFGDHTLDAVVSDKLYYANPSTFNDPLDTRPSLELDLDERELKKLLMRLVARRDSAEMIAAAETIWSYVAPDLVKKAEKFSRLRGAGLIEEIEFDASDSDYSSEDAKSFLLGKCIEEELLQQYDKGIVSLAERVTCPLMWSHYGDQHRGVCIGYSAPVGATGDLHKVKYGGSRLVKASKVAAMLDGNDVARGQVDEAVLLRKAASWRYEREWRLIGPRELHDSPLELEEIIFGMRCKTSAKFTVVKALERRDRPVKFYEMRDIPGKFTLRKHALNYSDELFDNFPRRCLSS